MRAAGWSIWLNQRTANAQKNTRVLSEIITSTGVDGWWPRSLAWLCYTLCAVSIAGPHVIGLYVPRIGAQRVECIISGHFLSSPFVHDNICFRLGAAIAAKATLCRQSPVECVWFVGPLLPWLAGRGRRIHSFVYIHLKDIHVCARYNSVYNSCKLRPPCYFISLGVNFQEYYGKSLISE